MRGFFLSVSFPLRAARAGQTDRVTDALVLAWLLLPNLIFVAGWLRPEWGVPAALLMVVGAIVLVRSAGGTGGAGIAMPLHREAIVLALLVALPWLWLSGIGHFLFANADWVVRDAVLADLVQRDWPVVYADVPQGEVLLRAPLGLYLPAAVLSKFTGVEWADLWLFGWCHLGVALVFYLLVRASQSLRDMLARVLVFVLFSGMDVVGAVLHGQYPGLASHMEWWAGLFQYSSHTTQLFWVPNHALPGWLAIAWLLGRTRGPLPSGYAVALVACVPLWSPLTALGLAPLFAVAMWPTGSAPDRWSALVRGLLHPGALLIAGTAVFLIYPYLLLPGAALPATLATSGLPVGGFWLRYVVFVILEFGLLAILLLRRDPHDRLVWAAVIVLLTLPLVRFGPYNDLAMRASIPALAVIALRLAEWFAQRWTRDPGQREEAGASLAMLVFAIGALTPLQEAARAMIAPRWLSDPARTVMMVTRGNAPHYLAPAQQAWVERFMRPYR